MEDRHVRKIGTGRQLSLDFRRERNCEVRTESSSSSGDCIGNVRSGLGIACVGSAGA